MQITNTDTGNAERLIRTHGTTIRSIGGQDTWLAWDGRVWRHDRGAIDELAKATVAAMLLEAAADPRHLRSELAWAERSLSAPRLRAMVDLARTDARIRVAPSDLDAPAHLLNTPSGLVDLRTGELQPHDPAALLTLITAVPYDPVAEAPMWQQALLRAMNGDQRLVEHLQRLLGYALTGETIEQKFFVFIGPGGTGKSTALKVVLDLLGNYGRTAAQSVFVADRRRGRGPEPEIARLLDARLVVTSEIDGDADLDAVRMKSLTGGENIAARDLYAPVVERRPRFKILICANHFPRLDGADDAMGRRLHLVRWDARLGVDRDPRFESRVAEEAPGILAWLVRGAVAWYRDGLGTPPVVDRWVAELRTANDPMGRFLSVCVVPDPQGSAEATALYERYRRWCDEEAEYVRSQKAFGSALGERGFRRERSSGGRFRYLGMRLAH